MKQRSKLVRGLWAAAGAACFGLGAVGSVLPILPTTPFILLAAFCFARSSDRLNERFKQTALYKKVLEGLVTKRCMTVRAKLSIIVPVTVLMGIGFALMGRVPVGRAILAIVWAAHVAYFGFVVKTDRGDAQASGRRSRMPLVRTELFGLLGDARKHVWLQVGCKMLALASQIAMALTAAHVVQLAYAQQLDAGSAAMALAIVVAGIAVRMAADRGESRTAYLASVDVKRILRGKVYGKLLRLGSSYRESVTTSKVVQLAVEGVEQLETYFSLFLSQLFYALAAPVVLLFVLGPIVSWKVAVILLVFVPLIPVSIMAVQKIAKRLLAKYWGSYTRLGDTFLENLQGLTTLKVYEADGEAAQRMDRDSEDFRIATMNVLKMQLNSTTVMDIGAYGGAAAGMIAALMELHAGAIDLGGVVAVLLLAAEFFLPMRRLGSYFHVGMNGMAASDSIFELLELPEPAAGAQAQVEGERASFALDGVSFSYDGNRQALDGVSMSFPEQSLVSIVGESGCGKSTVANLLMGRNRAYSGSATVNGAQVRDVDGESLMAHVTLVSRGSHVFKGSVRDNLLLAAPDADDGQLAAALDEVRLLDFVNGQGGLDMALAEGGANLSGGQRQRLVLARALLHDTPAYIFDEATSSIDAESEELIMQAVRKLARERTVVLISHRLANVVESDRVYLMEHGKVAESGTHAELMEAGGAYARLFNQQAELESARPEPGAEQADRAGFAEAACNPSPLSKPIASGQAALSGRQAAPAQEAAASQPDACARKRDSGLSIMGRLIGLVRPMAPIMCLAVLLGVAGFLCAIFLTVLAGYGALGMFNPPALFAALVALAVARGLLHYGEQYCNHYIAFKMLALLRHRVFGKLRTLAPAKLEGRDKGALISLITGDIELLEVFYAHTVSPIAIAVATSAVMVAYLSSLSWAAGLVGCAAYLAVGLALPLANGRRVAQAGLGQRDAVADLNALVLDSLYGLDETIQYGDGAARAQLIDDRSRAIANLSGEVNRAQRSQVAATDALIQAFSWGMLACMLALLAQGATGFGQAVLATLALMGSFGPVVALSNLSTTLSGTLAAGQRVLDLMEEEPETPEVSGREPCSFGDARLAGVSFSYGGQRVLDGCSLHVPAGKVTGIHGPSGSGKSTICKLLMRFWDADEGTVSIAGRDVRGANTADLRSLEAYVTQDTWLFHESIADNIRIGRAGADMGDVIEASKRASLHDFVSTLPEGYDTMVGELGDTLSDGERQRIGLARAFLHNAPLMLLDEPTSNLDALNEAAILRSLSQMGAGKTVVLVSHRASTMALADAIVEMDSSRAS